MTWPLVDDDNTACMDCDRILPEGSPYSARPVAMTETGGTIADLICVYCEYGPAQYCPDTAPTEAQCLGPSQPPSKSGPSSTT